MTRWLKTSAAALTAVLLLAASETAHASLAPKWSDDQLVDFSAAIVRGRVSAMTTGRDTFAIYTYVTIDVTEVLKGAIAERQIVLKQAGGEVEDLALSVAGQARFAVGEEVIVFAEVRPRDGTLYTTALWQGKWTVERDAASGQLSAVRSVPDAAGAEIDRRNVLAFSAAVASRAGQEGREAEAFVVKPADTPVSGGAAPYFYAIPTTRWAVQPVRTDIQLGGEVRVLNGGTSEIVHAWATWTAAGAQFRYAQRSLTAPVRCSPMQSAAGVVHIFGDPCGEISSFGGTLALTYTWLNPNVTTTASGVVFSAVVESIIITNDGTTADQFIGNPLCFEAIMLHELGHSLGLAHSADFNAVMFAQLNFAQCSASLKPLQPDDIDGVNFIYPQSGSPPPVPPTPPPAPPIPPTPPVPPVPPPPPPPPLAITPIPGQMLTVNGVAVVAFTVSGGTVPASALTVSVSTSNPTLLPPTGLTLNHLGNGQWQLTIQPAAERRGGAVVTIAISDGGGTRSLDFGVTVGPPNAPERVSATLSGSGVLLTWSPPPAGQSGPWPVERYAIAGGTSPNGSDLPVILTPNAATSYAFPAMPNGTYYFRVYAIGPIGISDPALGGAAVAHGAPVPGPTSALTGALIGAFATLSWNPGSGSSTTQLELGTAPGTSNIGTFTTGAPPFSASTAPLGTGTYWVRARGTFGSLPGIASNDIAFTIPSGACSVAPGTPILLPVTVRAGQTTASWLPASGAAASQYRLEVMPAAGAVAIASLTTTGAVSSLVLPALPGGYAVQVFAENGCGSSARSNVMIVP